MQSVTVATETQRRIRQRELAAADEKEAQEREEARKNKGFTQGHCCKVSDEAAFCLIQRPYISKTLLT
ncbi:hypothetical protein BMT70_25845, partial [Escherichia coli]